MIRARPLKIVYSLLLALALTLAPHLTSAQENTPEAITLAATFTYQGYLEQGGVPLTATCDMQFALFDALTAGTQIGTTLTRTNLAVNGGVFNVPLDFGGTAFNGEDRYLAISVRCPAGSGAYTALTPRQPITPVPSAMYANQAPWAGLTGVPAGFADGVDDIGADWTIFGNAGTQAGLNFIGTTDQQPLEIWVDSMRALRLENHGNSPNVIGGHAANYMAIGVAGGTIGGGGNNPTPNRVTDAYGTIGGGISNQVGDAFGSVDDRSYGTIGGGEANLVNSRSGTIGGGSSNTVSGRSAVVSGGESNRASGANATVGGGYENVASGLLATLAGGHENTVSGGSATVGGGYGNTASGDLATVSGGRSNTASALYSTVGGGQDNMANGSLAMVGGGSRNTASGNGATVSGGYFNDSSGDFSFAAGYDANVNGVHDFSFVWSGGGYNSTDSFGANTFTARAPGGVRFYSASAGTTNGVELAAGAGAWSSLSDRNAKANFDAVDTRAVLDALVNLPVTTWNYLTQDDSIRHIGVMAQDFYAAFGVGEDDTHISTIDADGVLFAAVQGLNAKLEDENAALRAEVETLHGQNAALETRLARLEALADGGHTASLLPVSLLPFGLLLIGGLAGVWVAQRKPSP